MRPSAAACLVVLATVAPVAAIAQATDSVWVSGTVVNVADTPIPDAEVKLGDSSRVVRTDSSGRFRARVAVGQMKLVVRRLGFTGFSTDLTLAAGPERRYIIELRTVSQMLDAVVSYARPSYMPPDAPRALDDFYRRRNRGGGKSFTRAELERWGGFRGALATVPGVRVGRDQFGDIAELRISRCQGLPTAWFVDGHRTYSVPMIFENEIEALEIYRGASNLPIEAMGDACAAVYIWTRRTR